MQSKAATVDAYLAELPAEASKALSRLRALIRKAAPGLHTVYVCDSGCMPQSMPRLEHGQNML